MDKTAKSSPSNVRKPLFFDIVKRSDLEKTFDVIKHDDFVYFIAAQSETGSSLFAGYDCVIRFFIDLSHADLYRQQVQDKIPQYKFFVVRFHAVNGIAKAISEAQMSKFVKSVAVSVYQKDVLVDVDLVYNRKQFLN